MVGHADNFTDSALDRVAQALEAPLALAEERGAKIIVEPMIHCVVNSPDSYFALKKRVQSDAFGINLDILNLFTLADMYAPTEGMKRICGALAGEYDLVHCKDLVVTKGVHIHVDETPLGTGVADWGAVLPAIADSLPPDGWFIYEHIKTVDDARAGNAMLRDLCREAGITLGT
jgi:sugar phosphate isomerase/epimerase